MIEKKIQRDCTEMERYKNQMTGNRKQDEKEIIKERDEDTRRDSIHKAMQKHRKKICK